jgi:molybdate transport system substrate-binding protein
MLGYMHARHALILAAVLPLLAVAGCGDDDEDAAGSSGSSQLTVSAAASLQEVLTQCAPDAKLQFAGSDELAAQIRQDAPVDVFAAANTKIPDELAGEGKLEDPVEFASNQLVLAVPADSDIQGLDDLEGSGVKLVMGAEGVPVGDYTRTVLGNLPPAQGEAILANVRSEEPDVKGVVGKLTQGAADAGFVYATDVKAAGEDLRAIELPADLGPVATYGAGVVTASEHKDDAQTFVDGLVDGACHDALLEAGFGEP